jgi:hypothetical protein
MNATFSGRVVEATHRDRLQPPFECRFRRRTKEFTSLTCDPFTHRRFDEASVRPR